MNVRYASIHNATLLVLFFIGIGIAAVLLPAQRSCYRAETSDTKRSCIKELVAHRGVTEAYDTVVGWSLKEPRGEQHHIGHLFGEVLWNTAGAEGAIICDERFNSGCFHAFFREAFSRGGQGILRDLASLCLQGASSVFACLHGIGHGVASHLGGSHIAEALVACRTLPGQLNTPLRLNACFTGVFMEYNLGGREGSELPRILNKDFPHEPCSSSAVDTQSSCYFVQPLWWQSVRSPTLRTFTTMGQWCRRVSDKKARDACHTGIGYALASTNHSQWGDVLRACSSLPDSIDAGSCVAGVVLARQGTADSL